MIRPTFIASIALMLLNGLAQAEPSKPGRCSGTLSRLAGEWVIRTGREGICAFGNEEVKTKVLAVCSEGQRCEVVGLVGDCESGECTEIRRVHSVRRR
jgi:hypothetical protein